MAASKRTLIAGITVALIGGVCVALAHWRGDIDPPIPQVEAALEQLGLVVPAYLEVNANKDRSDVEVAIHVTNRGRLPITILKSHTTCGCATVDLPKEKIDPGGKAECLVKVSHVSAGQKRFQVELTTDEARSPQHIVTIAAHGLEIAPYFLGHPPGRIELVGQKNGPPIERMEEILTCETKGSENWIKSLSSSLEGLKCSIRMRSERPSPTDGHVTRRYALIVKKSSSKSVMREEGVLALVGSSSVGDVHRIHVVTSVISPFTAKPSTILLTEPKTIQLLGVGADATRVRLNKVEGPLDVVIDSNSTGSVVARVAWKTTKPGLGSRRTFRVEFLDAQTNETAILEVFAPKDLSP